MDDEKIIKEDFEKDNSKITSIKPIPKYGEHYYLVKGEDDNGEFEVEVFVEDSSVLILPT